VTTLLAISGPEISCQYSGFFLIVKQILF